MKRVAITRKMATAEFTAWEDEQPERHEFYSGETFANVGGTAGHNPVIMNLGSRIAAHLDGTRCQAFTEGMKIQISDGVMCPDVVVTCDKAEGGDRGLGYGVHEGLNALWSDHGFA